MDGVGEVVDTVGARGGQQHLAVLAAELDPAVRHLHAHFLHTPASVARYAALLSGRSWSASAHAKDIWTTPGWEKREKLAEAAWTVTCTAVGRDHLATLAPEPGRVALLYHGLDLADFPPPAPRPRRDGGDPTGGAKRQTPRSRQVRAIARLWVPGLRVASATLRPE